MRTSLSVHGGIGQLALRQSFFLPGTCARLVSSTIWTALPEWRVLDLEDPEEGWADQHQRAGEDVAGEERTCHSLVAAALNTSMEAGTIQVPGSAW